MEAQINSDPGMAFNVKATEAQNRYEAKIKPHEDVRNAEVNAAHEKFHAATAAIRDEYNTTLAAAMDEFRAALPQPPEQKLIGAPDNANEIAVSPSEARG